MLKVGLGRRLQSVRVKSLIVLFLMCASPALAWTKRPLFQVLPGSPFTGGSGTALSFPLLAPNGTAAAPSYSFSGNSGQGMYRVGNSTVFGTSGTDTQVFNFSFTGEISLPSNGQFDFSSTTDPKGSVDAGISRIAAGVLGSRSTAAAPYFFQVTAGRSTLAADYTNATTTFSSTLLAVAGNVTSGRKYTWYLNLFLTESTAADGVKLDFNGGTATATNFIGNCVLANAVGVIVTQTNAVTNALATVINAAATTDANQHFYSCSGSFEPSSTGTFVVRAAQNAHSTGTLTIKRGSWFWIEDTP